MISFGILDSWGVLETIGMMVVLVATVMDRRFAFDGFEPILLRSGMNDYSGCCFLIGARGAKRNTDGHQPMLGRICT